MNAARKSAKKKKDPAPTEISSAKVTILNTILQKVHGLTTHIDTQVNMTIAISSAIFIFSSSKIYTQNLDHQLYLLTLSIFAALSVVTALFAVHPPRIFRKRGQKESLMYHNRISKFESPKDYKKLLKRMMEDEDRVIEEYSREIYNVSKYYYKPKRVLYKLSRNFLMLGFISSFILVIASL